MKPNAYTLIVFVYNMYIIYIYIYHSLCFSRFDKASQAATCSSKNVETQRHTPPEKSIDEVFQDIVCEKADVFHWVARGWGQEEL